LNKSYHLKYGSLLDKHEVKKMLEVRWDICSTEHDSSYFGVYYKYSGLYADNLTITDNHISTPFQEWLYENNKDFITLISISISKGRNKDKLSKYKYLKNIFNKEMFSVISDNCFET